MLPVERWIIAALRHRKFFSIEDLNQAIRELRDRINQRPFRKREGSRASQFAALDKPALNRVWLVGNDAFEQMRYVRTDGLRPVHHTRGSPFQMLLVGSWTTFGNGYSVPMTNSVPYNLVQEMVEVRSTPTTVELFHKGRRVASHLRARVSGRRSVRASGSRATAT